MSVPLKAGVLIADDHGLVRDGLRMVIDAAPDLEVVAVAEDGNRAVERGLDPRVDLALLDVAMPRRTGLQAARELTARRPELRVLMLSMHNVFDYFLEAVKAGASGYVLKTVADRDLVLACRAALRGETFIYPGMVRSLLREHLERAARGESQLPDELTPRESEVIKLIAEGLTLRRDRPRADDQPTHRRAPPREHPRQARHAQPRRTHPLRHPPRPRRALRRWGRSPMAHRVLLRDAVRDDPHRRRR